MSTSSGDESLLALCQQLRRLEKINRSGCLDLCLIEWRKRLVALTNVKPTFRIGLED